MENRKTYIPTGERYREPDSAPVPEEHSERRPRRRKYAEGLICRGNLDPVFLTIVLVLLIIGLVMMFSASYGYSYNHQNGDALYYFKRQSIFAGIGVVLMLLVSRFNYRKLNSKMAWVVYFGTIALLIITLIVNHGKRSDFKRWIHIGSFSFQPSEFAKFALILIFAYFFSRQYGTIKKDKWNSLILTFVYVMSIGALVGLIYKENHYSCTILVGLLGLAMMYLGGVKKRYFIIAFAIIAVAAAILILIPDKILKPYAAVRIIAWTDKTYQPTDARWQTNNSLRAIASGGWFGVGIGKSTMKHLYVSEPQNDFIFSIVCEELGIVGAIIILALFGALIWRAFKIASGSRDVFSSSLCFGIAMLVALQVILNIAVITDTFPNTGIPFPFFSYGGTALVILLCEMGLILSISRKSNVKKV